MKKSAPPPQGRDAIFWKILKFFLKWTTLALGDPQTFSWNRRPGGFEFENLRLLFGSTRALRAQDRALRARSIQRTQHRTQQTHATHARNKLVQRPIRPENTQNRVLPPKTSPIEQISDRFGPISSPLWRVTLQQMFHFKGWNLCRKFLTNWTAIKTQPITRKSRYGSLPNLEKVAKFQGSEGSQTSFGVWWVEIFLATHLPTEVPALAF